jgi:hypothetical protein
VCPTQWERSPDSKLSPLDDRVRETKQKMGILMGACVCLCACGYMYASVCLCLVCVGVACLCASVNTSECVYSCVTCVCVRMRTYVCMYECVHAYVYVCAYVRTRARMCACWCVVLCACMCGHACLGGALGACLCAFGFVFARILFQQHVNSTGRWVASHVLRVSKKCGFLTVSCAFRVAMSFSPRPGGILNDAKCCF